MTTHKSGRHPHQGSASATELGSGTGHTPDPGSTHSGSTHAPTTSGAAQGTLNAISGAKHTKTTTPKAPKAHKPHKPSSKGTHHTKKTRHPKGTKHTHAPKAHHTSLRSEFHRAKAKRPHKAHTHSSHTKTNKYGGPVTDHSTGPHIDGQTHDAFMRAYNSGLEWATNYVALHPEVITGAAPGAASKHHLKGYHTPRHSKSHHSAGSSHRSTHSGSGKSTGGHGAKGLTSASLIGRNSTQFKPPNPTVPNAHAIRVPH